MKIIIDPGHGGVWRPQPPRGDPGVVHGTKIESRYTWLYAQTLRDVLSGAGFSVVMTRSHDNYTVPLRERTVMTRPEDLFISLHFDSVVGGRRMIFFAGQNNNIRGESIRLAENLDEYLKTGVIRPSTTSRFGRLYIDDARCPAVLVEIDRIDRADGSLEARRNFANLILAGIGKHLAPKRMATQIGQAQQPAPNPAPSPAPNPAPNPTPNPASQQATPPRFNTPFQRVFILRGREKTQLNIERMSIVGDKLYIAIKEDV